MNRPTTLSGPSTRAQIAPTTLLSIPPDNPTTMPFLRNRRRTCSRRAVPIRSVSAEQSRVNNWDENAGRCIGLKPTCPTRLSGWQGLLQLPADESGELVQAVKVLR